MYSQEITRRHRAAFIILIDQSGSMQEKIRFGRMSITKALAVSIIANAIITELVDRCRRTDGLRNYYDIAVIGYSDNKVDMLFGGEGFITIDRLAQIQPEQRLLDIEEILPDGSTTMVRHTIVEWIKPKAEGNTPMYEAFHTLHDMAASWCSQLENRESFPLLAINITDGEASDCDDNELRDIAGRIRRLKTDDGNVLLMNIHISTDITTPSIIFPMPEELANAGRYARTLAECSSIMPDAFNDAIRELKGAGAVPPFYGMGYNASIIELLSILNIGSRSVTNIE